jgi:hypothetical protein
VWVGNDRATPGRPVASVPQRRGVRKRRAGTAAARRQGSRRFGGRDFAPGHTAGTREGNLPPAPPLQHAVTARRVAVVRAMVVGGANVERRVNRGCGEVSAACHAIVVRDVDMLGVLREVGVSLAVDGDVTRLAPSKMTVLSAVFCTVVVNSLRFLRWILNGVGEEVATSIG